MSMLDIHQPQAEADGKLVKVAMSRDGTEVDTFIFEAQVAFSIRREDCEIVSKILPGAGEMFDRAAATEDNEKFTATSNPDVSGLRLMLSSASGGKVAIEAGAEIRSVKLVASKKGVTVTIKFGIGGQTAEAAGRIVELLGNAVTVSTSNDQQDLFRPTGRADAPTAKVGDLVTARSNNDTIVGRVASAATADSPRVSIEDFDSDYMVDESEIVGVITLDGDVAALRRSFKDRCKRKGIIPTWNAVLLAGVESWVGGKSATGKQPLTADIMARAFELLETGAVEALPREPGAHQSPVA